MTPSNNSSEDDSMYLRMLKNIEAKGKLFLSLYNEETKRYELLSFAMYMYDCSFYFNDMLLRWKEHLPHQGEAKDVDFLKWKERISIATQNALKTASNDECHNYTDLEKNLRNDEIEGLYAIYKGSDDFKKKIEDMSQYLLEHNADIEQLVFDVGNSLIDILGKLEDTLLYADESKYEDLYRRLSSSWEINWPTLKHDEYDTFVQRLTPRFLKKNIEKRIKDLHNQFFTNQFELRWHPLINCSSDWDTIYDSETNTIDTQAIGRYAIAHRSEHVFTNETLPTLLAFVKLITFMQEQVVKIESNHKKSIILPDPLKDAIEKTDFSNIENHLFISHAKGNGFDYKRLYVVIRDKILPLIVKKYEWYALWRWCLHKGWLSEEKHTSFANQMRDWFPEKVAEGVAASMNDFDQGGKSYLHKTSPREYNEDDAAKDAKKFSSKDYSVEGAKRIVTLSKQLEVILKDVQLNY